MTTGGTDRLSNLHHPANFEAPTSHRRFSVSSVAVAANILKYPNRLKVPGYAKRIMAKMLEIHPRKRAELIDIAARVPKQQAGEKPRPLMEVAWVDYKTHVSPGGIGNSSYTPSLYSTNTMTSLLGHRDRS
jgi:hypothetical protein